VWRRRSKKPKQLRLKLLPGPKSKALRLQREQMAMQQEQMNFQQAQYREQLAISNAPPPPAPQPVAMTARSAIEMPVATAAGSADTGAAATPQSVRAGTGRRKLRTDRAGGLNIPAVGAYP
jgi:hypothetical protein